MADDKSPQKNPTTHPPPPLDPFPTYGQPFPRSSSESKEDPFIAFRRFADSQISSLLSSVAGLPALFAQSPSTGRFADLDEEMTRRRQQLEEGWRKQWEQEREEKKQQWDQFKKQVDQWEPTPLATHKSGPENVPSDLDELRKHSNNISTPEGTAKREDCWFRKQDPRRSWAAKCPALREGETELDLYEQVLKQNTEYETTMAQKEEALEKKIDASWKGVGWDGKQKAKGNEVSIRGQKPEHLEGFTSHTFRSTRGFDPVSNPDQTLPWLLTSPYSPIYLCNPVQPRLFRVDMIDEPMVPFRISRPVFKDMFSHSVSEELATKLPWADAFEDLVALEQTGKMVNRDYSTWQTPNSWIHDMVARGSLGPRWGFDEQHQLMKKDNTNNSQNLQPSAILWPSADAVQVAIKRAEDTQNEEDPSTPTEEGSQSVPSNSFWSSSSSWSSSFGVEENPNDVVSTMTTTIQRTLLDGSIETKRVLKKRFADGREESNESVEIENSPTQITGGQSSKEESPFPSKILNEVARLQDKQTQTSEDKQDAPIKSGWFWR